MKTKKGFTLIELLIVIAIIGILAVAFLPTLLGAPAKGRDTARIADLQKIQKVLVNADLEGRVIPAPDSCINGTTFTTLVADFGGTVPVDPQPANILPGLAALTPANCAGQYYFNQDPSLAYNFGLYAHVELRDNANTECDDAYAGTILAPVVATTAANLCYAILTQ